MVKKKQLVLEVLGSRSRFLRRGARFEPTEALKSKICFATELLGNAVI